jgi:hypothetical protein
MGWDLPSHPPCFVDIHQIAYWLRIDCEFALSADDFRGIVLPGRHHSTSEQICYLPSVELYNSYSIIPIIMFSKLGLHSRYPRSYNALDLGVLSEEPQSKVDVMDGAVDEYATGKLGICDEEAGWVEHVACLGAEDGGASYEPRFHFVKGIAVGSVEAAGESAHYFEMRLLLCGID